MVRFPKHIFKCVLCGAFEIFPEETGEVEVPDGQEEDYKEWPFGDRTVIPAVCPACMRRGLLDWKSFEEKPARVYILADWFIAENGRGENLLGSVEEG